MLMGAVELAELGAGRAGVGLAEAAGEAGYVESETILGAEALEAGAVGVARRSSLNIAGARVPSSSSMFKGIANLIRGTGRGAVTAAEDGIELTEAFEPSAETVFRTGARRSAVRPYEYRPNASYPLRDYTHAWHPGPVVGNVESVLEKATVPAMIAAGVGVGAGMYSLGHGLYADPSGKVQPRHSHEYDPHNPNKTPPRPKSVTPKSGTTGFVGPSRTPVPSRGPPRPPLPPVPTLPTFNPEVSTPPITKKRKSPPVEVTESPPSVKRARFSGLLRKPPCPRDPVTGEYYSWTRCAKEQRARSHRRYRRSGPYSY